MDITCSKAGEKSAVSWSSTVTFGVGCLAGVEKYGMGGRLWLEFEMGWRLEGAPWGCDGEGGTGDAGGEFRFCGVAGGWGEKHMEGKMERFFSWKKVWGRGEKAEESASLIGFCSMRKDERGEYWFAGGGKKCGIGPWIETADFE